ncbi:hypothetical protein CA984_13140 [Streptosporangium minutum]|uniref:Uncharacterized protein n=1 Tax=Streptosporangium minutum TaxID=569862 RepID=A0A243RPI9_9ACTN|nr:hypothetical protein CA984_13140 [Streptosporangium minutum]
MAQASGQQQPGAGEGVHLGWDPARPLLGRQVLGQRDDLRHRPQLAVAQRLAEADGDRGGGEDGQRGRLDLGVVVDAGPRDGQQVVADPPLADQVHQVVEDAEPDREPVLEQGEEHVDRLSGLGGAPRTRGGVPAVLALHEYGQLKNAASRLLGFLVWVELWNRHGRPNVRSHMDNVRHGDGPITGVYRAVFLLGVESLQAGLPTWCDPDGPGGH